MVSDSPLAKAGQPPLNLSFLTCVLGWLENLIARAFVRSSVFVEQRALQVQLGRGNLHASEAPFPMDALL